ncbi:hypothetical protein [Rhizobium sp. NFR03]|uniref:YunG family protein n=1 Tax=Rhizobium sp. NFR03 TaxID=1566263 RepID=UPI0032983F33
MSALVVQDIMGGELLKTKIDGAWHFYNRIGSTRFDATASQFCQPVAYDDFPADRLEAFSDTSTEQYRFLAANVARELARRSRESGLD